MKKISFIIIIIILLTQTAFSQNYFYQYAFLDSNYFSLRDSLVSFFDTNDSLKDVRGSGFKDFQRWDNEVTGRIDNNGSLNSYLNDYFTVYTNINSSSSSTSSSSSCGNTSSTTWCNSSFQANWKPLGNCDRPKLDPIFTNTYTLSDDQGNGTGWMSAIWISPSNSDYMLAGANQGGLWKTTNGGELWTPISDNIFDGMGINNIAVDPTNTNIIYVAPSFGNRNGLGIWKTSDGGATWIQQNINSPTNNEIVFKIVILESNSSILFAITENSILKSINGGNTWSSINNISGTNLSVLRDIEINTTLVNGNYIHTLFVAGNIFAKSTDLGITFTQIPLNYTVSSSNNYLYDILNAQIAVSSYFPSIIYRHYEAREAKIVNNEEITTFKVIEKSTDAGVTWTQRFSEPLETLNPDHPASPPERFRMNLGERKYCFEMSTLNSSLIYFGGTEFGLYRDDALPNPKLEFKQYGTTFYLHDDIRSAALKQVNGKDLLIVATDGGIAKTTYDGTSSSWDWTDISTGLQVQQIYRIDKSSDIPSRILTGHQDLGTIYYDGLSKEWFFYRTISGDGGTCLFDPVLGQRFIFTSNGYIKRGTFDASLPSIPGFFFAPMNYAVPIELKRNSKNAYLVGKRSGSHSLYVMPDIFNTSYNNTKDIKLNPLGFQDGASALKVSNTEDTLFLCLGTESTKPKFYRSFDNGTTLVEASNFVTNWTTSDIKKLLDQTFITDIVINPKNSEEIWVSFGYFGDIRSTQSRILHSTDAGTTWSDFSDGLFCSTHSGIDFLPVNSIIYDELSDNNMLYAGTDMGVYYRNDNTQKWVRFSENLPFVQIKQLIIDRKEKRLIAATHGRGIWYTDIPCCDEAQPADDLIETSVIWNEEKVVGGNIIVPNGVTLTLKDATFWFKPNGKIIVNQGGKLIIQNALLTSYCKSFWGGIEVHGNPSLNSDQNLQGFVNISGSTIQYAYRGIFCGHETNSSLYGGVVKATGSKFKDCRVGIAIYPHNPPSPNQNTSANSITDCRFLWTESLPDGSGKGMLHGISLWGVYNVEVAGNEFINRVPEKFNGEVVFTDKFRGNGILGIDATFVVDRITGYSGQQPTPPIPPACRQPVLKKNLFEGLTNGVVLLNNDPTARNSIVSSTFKNCVNGIKANTDIFTKIFDNTFLWDEDFVNDDINAPGFVYYDGNGVGTSSQYAVGIYHNGSDGFLSEGNTFTYKENTSTLQNFSGFIFSNVTGTSPDYAVRNSTINEGSSSKIIGKVLLDGCFSLQLTCNEYCEIPVDWYIKNTNSSQISNQTSDANNFTDPSSSLNLFNVNYYITPPATASTQVSFQINSLFAPSSCSYTVPSSASQYNYTNASINPQPNTNSKCLVEATNFCAAYKTTQVLPGDTYDGESSGGGGGDGLILSPTKEGLKQKSLEKIFNKEYGTARKLLFTIEVENQEDEDFVNYYSTLIEIFENGKSYSNLNNEQRLKFKQIASHQTVTGEKARLLLLSFYDEIVITDPATNNYINKPNQSSKEVEHITSNLFRIYPNPSENTVYLDYKIKKEDMPATIEVISSIGVTLYSKDFNEQNGKIEINLGQWSAGLFIINVRKGNTVLYSDKVTLIK